jgi:uncharacterized protein (DUF488 family)
MEIYTIGFTKKSAQEFFELLKASRITRLIDVRLHNTSQLAAFTKKGDLEYFLQAICGIEYVHEPLLAPTGDLLAAYQSQRDWKSYAKQFLILLRDRQVEKRISKDLFAGRTVLLCSEADADHCHRLIVAQYLRRHWGDIKIVHL